VFDARGVERRRTTPYAPAEPADIEARDAEARARPEAVRGYADELRQTLEAVLGASLDATNDRGAPAAFLSGGVDSSLVVALAAALGHKPVCYSIAFSGDVPNELAWSRLVAEHVGAEHRIIEVTPAAMTETLPETVYLLDDPIGDPLTVPNHLLAATAQRDGFRRVLNGEGGDPCFGGPKNIPMVLAEWYDPHEGARERAYLRSYQKLYDDLPRLLAPELAAEIEAGEPLWAPIAPYLADEGQKSFLNKLQTINLVFKGGNSILVKVEKLAAAHGLVALSPLFEREVADRAWEAPPSFKLAGNIEKLVLKTAVADLLPAAIIDRKKSGMLVPVHPWFQGELKGYAATAFERSTVLRRGLFNIEAVEEMRKYRGATTTRGFYGAKLWLLLTLEIWMRLYLDGEASYFERAEARWLNRP
jgi:asparagine synthase (glutamine-hydrolysing)